MKKELILIVLIVAGLSFIGCSSSETANLTEAGEILAEDEYSIYENGQAIFTLTDIDWFYYTGGDPFSFANPLRYKWEGHPELMDGTTIYDFSNNQLSTKRGLMVGDTLRQFANKYPDVYIGLPEYRLETTPSKLLENQEEYNVDDTFVAQTRTYFLLDGTQKGGSFYDVENEEYYSFNMKIIFEYNTIIDIEIDYMD